MRSWYLLQTGNIFVVCGTCSVTTVAVGTKNMWDMYSHFRDEFMERTEISAFFLTFFVLAGAKQYCDI